MRFSPQVTYLFLDIVIILIPFLYSFEKRVAYHKKYPALFASIAVTGVLFIVWDGAATFFGDWGFNSHFITGIRLFGLPIEEILFFVVVPYSCIFIYEVLHYCLPPKPMIVSARVMQIVIMIFICCSMLAREYAYTGAAMLSCAGVLSISLKWRPHILVSSHFWLYIIISYVPFMIFNYILTALPVITYNPQEFLGFRILTIPLEDFFYSFSLLTTYLLFYDYFFCRFDLKRKKKGE